MTGTDLASVPAATRLLPVLTVPSTATAGPPADALTAGGARCAEATFRTSGAEQCSRRWPHMGGLTVGAGTVLTPEQAERAVAAGARLVVSPGFDDEVVDRCRELGVPVVPGIATATELMRVLRAGADTVKPLPAEPLGGLRSCGRSRHPSPGRASYVVALGEVMLRFDPGEGRIRTARSSACGSCGSPARRAAWRTSPSTAPAWRART
ncbi:keto-deoxy-phosphogluconate aldolase [Streptomyces sp. NPDC046727]|uniref:bifunctional 4-hydroxy-2-oxoglutarate aldolase/2-dehydro-3-deoxy-phosphogluconate aldolase n=1 Tax=Streptomyces sp. NPDC046727 TaxID=3155373 RepID=UPI0034018471